MAATATAVVAVVARLVGEVGGKVRGVVNGEVSSGMVGGSVCCVLCLTPTYRRNRTRNIISRYRLDWATLKSNASSAILDL